MRHFVPPTKPQLVSIAARSLLPSTYPQSRYLYHSTALKLKQRDMPVTVVAAKQDAQPIAGNFRFIDIGVNLTDPVFRGYHRGRQKHEDDLELVLTRCKGAGVESMIITGGSLHESKEALELAKQHGFYATVGCHPTRSTQFDQFPGGPKAYLKQLDQVIATNLEGKGRVVAIGECGLDYDRTHFSPADTQKKHFRSQLGLAKKYSLPLFLHSRAAHADLVQILRDEGFGENGGRGVGAKGGVVHSFTGTPEEAIELMDMGFHISLNGCGMKTEENLTTVRVVRPDKIMFETDSPWCSMTTTHASRAHLQKLPASLHSRYFPQSTRSEAFIYGKPVKGRNEPTSIGGVAWVVHQLNQGIPFERITERAWRNTVELFGLHELA